MRMKRLSSRGCAANSKQTLPVRRTRLLTNHFRRVTQEKYFYSVLSKYRDEHLEAMDFSPARRRPGLVPSPSDYQHAVPNYPLPAPAHRQFPVQAPFNRTTFTPVPAVEVPTFDKQPYFNNIPTFKNVPASATTLPKPSERSASQFSVRKNEHLHSRHSFFGPPQSEASYDPFRASLGPSISVQKTRAGIRQHSSSPARYVKTSKSQGGNRFGSRRVEALKRNGSLRSSGMSSSSKSAKGPSVRPLSISSERSKSLSRVSNSSSQWATSIGSPATATVRRTYHRHKRSVSFDHRRRGSNTLANGSRNSLDAPSIASFPPIPMSSGLPLCDIPSSPPIQRHNVLRSAKEGSSNHPAPRMHNAKHIEKEARKVSNELEKVCLEAFYRSSTSGSTRSSTSGTNTPPTSASAGHQQKKAKIDKELLNRPLPPPPVGEPSPQTQETPRSYTVRELHEMRKRLAVKYAQDGTNHQQFFHNILHQLESLMPPAVAVDSRRVSSVPTGPLYEASREALNHLQAIPEEGRSTEFDDVLSNSLGSKGGKKRSVTEQTNYRKPDATGVSTTIRVVEPSSPASPSPWAPLNIRKPSENATQSRSRGARPYLNDQRAAPPPVRHSLQSSELLAHFHLFRS
jgi:serine/threonine-protein kinase HSL1, negative regulator of Swe1 kinase